MSQQKIFIWDFHGTLETGTVSILTEIANTLIRENGGLKEHTPTEFARIPNFSWNTFFQEHLPHYSKDEIDAVVQDAYNKNKFGHLMDKYSRPNEGAIEILTHIKSQNGTNIVVSNSRQDKLEYYLTHVGVMPMIDEYYGVDDGSILSRQDVLKRKTETLKRIINERNDTGIYGVGDTDTDFQAAEAAGVDLFFWLLPDNHKKEKLKSNKYALSNKLRFILSLEEITSQI